MKRCLKKIILITGGFLFCLNLIAQEAPGEVEDRPEIPNVGLLPFNYSYGVGEKAGNDALVKLAEMMFMGHTFDPFRINAEGILAEFNMEKGKNIEQIVGLALDLGMPLDFICHGTIYKCGKYYCLFVAMFPTLSDFYYSFYYRYYLSESELERVCREIVAEMNERVIRFREIEHLMNKTIYVDNTVPTLFVSSRTQDGGTKLDRWNLAKVNNVDYKEVDSFFNTMLIYNFHQARMYNLKVNLIPDEYLEDDPEIPREVDYIVSSDIVISEFYTILRTKVTERKGDKLLGVFDFPFERLNFLDLRTASKKAVMMITQSLLNETEQKGVGIIDLKLSGSSRPVFVESYFVGMGNQQDVLQPVGLVTLRVDNNSVLKFVPSLLLRPYIEDDTIYREEILSQMR